MYQAWARKQERLQAEQQEQLFLRECSCLEEILAAQEAGPVPPSHSACLLLLLSVLSLLSPFPPASLAFSLIWGSCA